VGASSDGDCGDRVALPGNKASWIEKVAELVNQGRIEGIADIRDESDRDGMRVVIELKRDTTHRMFSSSCITKPRFLPTSVQFLLLVDGQPRQLSLRQLLQEFLKSGTDLNRRYTNELEQAESRLHLVEGLLTALSELEVISILRQASDGSTAKITPKQI